MHVHPHLPDFLLDDKNKQCAFYASDEYLVWEEKHQQNFMENETHTRIVQIFSHIVFYPKGRSNFVSCYSGNTNIIKYYGICPLPITQLEQVVEWWFSKCNLS